LLVLAATWLAACAPVAVRSVPYAYPAQQPPTLSERVAIVLQEPARPNIKLGEVFVDAPGYVSRERLEANVRSGAANLGADAAWIVRDDTRLFPVVYVDPWWGPVGSGTGSTRRLIAVAIKYR
jgi:type IV pilus biogenesis protein CpaD/CtpE